MYEDDDADDQTKEPRTRGTRPTDRAMTAAAAPGAQPQQAQGGGMFGGPRRMPWDQGHGAWGQPQAAPNGNTGVVGPGQGQPPQQGGQPGWGGHRGHMGHQGMPNWQALAQQFQQRFAQSPLGQHWGLTGQGTTPPGQAPAAPPQGAPMQPQPGAAPQGQGAPFQDQIGRLAALFGRQQQPGGIVGPGQGPQNY